jgi:hypothetical protein
MMVLTYPVSKMEEREMHDVKEQVLNLLTLCLTSDKSRFESYYNHLKTKVIYMLKQGWITPDAYQYILKKVRREG